VSRRFAAPPDSGVVVVVPARNESGRVGTTVEAAASLPHVVAVVVVDDGSTDATGADAAAAGAAVVRHDRSRGKGTAMATGAHHAAALGYGALPLLFLDADVGATAGTAAPLVTPVRSGDADMTIGNLTATTPGGGHGFVVRLARDAIRERTGWVAQQPLSGQRCITRELFDAVQPLARGFGVETALTIDALRLGGRVVEVPVAMTHRVTGASFADNLHRARQWRDVWLAVHRRKP
jgi:glycosyltransferase involved in cell wall biosynthesis